eukprot:1447363-Amphidinium_carterae.1
MLQARAQYRHWSASRPRRYPCWDSAKRQVCSFYSRIYSSSCFPDVPPAEYSLTYYPGTPQLGTPQDTPRRDASGPRYQGTRPTGLERAYDQDWTTVSTQGDTAAVRQHQEVSVLRAQQDALLNENQSHLTDLQRAHQEREWNTEEYQRVLQTLQYTRSWEGEGKRDPASKLYSGTAKQWLMVSGVGEFVGCNRHRHSRPCDSPS